MSMLMLMRIRNCEIRSKREPTLKCCYVGEWHTNKCPYLIFTSFYIFVIASRATLRIGLAYVRRIFSCVECLVFFRRFQLGKLHAICSGKSNTISGAATRIQLMCIQYVFCLWYLFDTAGISLLFVSRHLSKLSAVTTFKSRLICVWDGQPGEHSTCNSCASSLE